jgi:hypothetical protein
MVFIEENYITYSHDKMLSLSYTGVKGLPELIRTDKYTPLTTAIRVIAGSAVGVALVVISRLGLIPYGMCIFIPTSSMSRFISTVVVTEGVNFQPEKNFEPSIIEVVIGVISTWSAGTEEAYMKVHHKQVN